MPEDIWPVGPVSEETLQPAEEQDEGPCACPTCLGRTHCGTCSAILALCGHCRACQYIAHQECVPE